MARWTYTITIINDMDRALELVSSSVPWGERSKPFPKEIAAGEYGEFTVYSGAGDPWGIEFYFSMRDKVEKKGEPHYGSFSFSVDIPYWKHKNKSSFQCNGIISQNGFEKIPDGAHDFSTTVTVFTALNSASLPGENLYKGIECRAEYCNLYDWNEIQKLKVVEPEVKRIEDFIPKENIFSKRKTDSRTEKISVPKKLWKEIVDRKYSDDYSKRNFVKDYFTVSAYEVRKNVTVSIAANQSYEKTLEVTNRSTVRRETREEFQIENTISGEGTGEKFTLSETLRMQYQISRLDEYCEENMESVREVFNYDAIDQDRDVVLWDLAEVLMLYRVNIKDKVELVGVGDYYVASTQKTYTSGAAQMEEEEDCCDWKKNLNCANSQNNYRLSDELPERLMDGGEEEPDDEFEALDVTARRAGVVQGNIRINNVNYRWMEVRSGTNRGMLFNPGEHRYRFRPNPHDDAWYNNHQDAWYNAMAREFQRKGDAGSWTQDNWNGGNDIRNLNAHNETYTARVY